MDVVNVLPKPRQKVFPTFQQGKDWFQFSQSHDFCGNAQHHRAHEKAAAILGECGGVTLRIYARNSLVKGELLMAGQTAVDILSVKTISTFVECQATRD